MNRHHPRHDRPRFAPPGPEGRQTLLRHIARAEDLSRAPACTLRDVVESDRWQGQSIAELARFAGGLDALGALDAEPLPAAEPCDLASINETDLPVVEAVLFALHEHRSAFVDAIAALTRSYTPPWLDGEYCTIVHRLIARAARSGLAEWHRDPCRTAAAFVWLALGGNRAMGRGRVIRARDVWQWYGVSDCRALARRICDGAQLGSNYSSVEDSSGPRDLQVVFGDADLLHSSFRRYLVQMRDGMMFSVAEDDRRRAQRRPVQMAAGNQILFKAQQLQPLWSVKGQSDTGRAVVMVALGVDADDDDYEVIGMSVPDARKLLGLVQGALDAPLLCRPSTSS